MEYSVMPLDGTQQTSAFHRQIVLPLATAAPYDIWPLVKFWAGFCPVFLFFLFILYE